jgi:transglutaminase-like putative cysteine protease
VIYDIRHLTTYAYEFPVSFARCSLRLEPRSGDGQELISHSVEIRPRPAERSARRDFFGTHIESVVFEIAHRHLRIDSRSRVSVARTAPGRTASSAAWESVRDAAIEATSLGPTSPVSYVFASSLVPVLSPVTAYAAESFPAGVGVLGGAVDLMHRIRNQFKYDPKATVISTPLHEVFDKRLPGFCSCDDRGPARPRPAGGLCERLSAHDPAAGKAASPRRGRNACVGIAVVRARAWLDRFRSDQ